MSFSEVQCVSGAEVGWVGLAYRSSSPFTVAGYEGTVCRPQIAHLELPAAYLHNEVGAGDLATGDRLRVDSRGFWVATEDQVGGHVDAGTIFEQEPDRSGRAAILNGIGRPEGPQTPATDIGIRVVCVAFGAQPGRNSHWLGIGPLS